MIDILVNALRDLTVHAELKPEIDILERHFLELKARVSRLDGVRMAFRRKCMGALSEEQAADVDSKVAEVLDNADGVEFTAGSATHLGPHPPDDEAIGGGGYACVSPAKAETTCSRHNFSEMWSIRGTGHGVADWPDLSLETGVNGKCRRLPRAS